MPSNKLAMGVGGFQTTSEMGSLVPISLVILGRAMGAHIISPTPASVLEYQHTRGQSQSFIILAHASTVYRNDTN